MYYTVIIMEERDMRRAEIHEMNQKTLIAAHFYSKETNTVYCKHEVISYPIP